MFDNLAPADERLLRQALLTALFEILLAAGHAIAVIGNGLVVVPALDRDSTDALQALLAVEDVETALAAATRRRVAAETR